MTIATAPSLRLGVLTDLHVAGDAQPPARWHGPFDFPGALPRALAALAWFQREACDALVLLGDLVHEPDDRRWEETYDSLATTWRGRILSVAGNHDPPSAAERGSAVVPWPTGAPHFVRFRGAADRAHGELVRCGPSRIVLSHFPIVGRARAFAARQLRYAGDLENADALRREVLRLTTESVVVLHGHLHARDWTTDGRILQLGHAAVVEAPHHASVVELGPRIVVRRIAMLAVGRVELAATERWEAVGTAWRACPDGRIGRPVASAS